MSRRPLERATRRRVGPRRVVAAGVLAFASVGCSTGDQGASATNTDGAPVVIATTSVWADVVANIACDGDLDVQTLVPVGGDPHGFEPSLADRGAMSGAVLVIANGLGLEEGLDATIEAVENEGVPVFRIGEHVDTISYGAGDGVDPHVWFDPQRVSSALPMLAERLITDGDLDAATVTGCLNDYQSALTAADQEIADLVGRVPDVDRVLVTSHDALGYFADRYGFEVIGTVIPASSGLGETNPGRLQDLAELIEQEGVPAVFTETQHSSEDAEALAGQLDGVELVTLATGTVGDSDGESGSYIELLRDNATAIVEALD